MWEWNCAWALSCNSFRPCKILYIRHFRLTVVKGIDSLVTYNISIECFILLCFVGHSLIFICSSFCFCFFRPFVDVAHLFNFVSIAFLLSKPFLSFNSTLVLTQAQLFCFFFCCCLTNVYSLSHDWSARSISWVIRWNGIHDQVD